MKVGDLVQQDYPPHTLDIGGCYDYRTETKYDPSLLGIVLKVLTPGREPVSVQVLWSTGKVQTVYAEELIQVYITEEGSCE